MSFAASVVKRQNYGDMWEIIYKFTGGDTDTGGDVLCPLTTIYDAYGWGYKDDKSDAIAGMKVYPSSGSGYVTINYTDPTADHTGFAVVRGHY